MADNNTVGRLACIGRTVHNRPCEAPTLPGEDVCEAHATARAEHENWWEWDDEDTAEDFRRQELVELRNSMLGIGVPVDTDEPTVLHVGDEEYRVLSSTRGGIRYPVTFEAQPDNTAVYECACRGWMINRRCSHIDRVMDFIGPDALPQKLPQWAEERGQCSALTVRGTQCRNTAIDGEAYCHQHLSGGVQRQPDWEAPAAVMNESTNERVRCQGTTQAGQQCQNLAQRGMVYCNRHRDPEARCPALNVRGAQCGWDKLDGEEFCQYHLPAREEGWNWWEWDDEDAAEEFRQRMQEQIEEERGVREPCPLKPSH